MIVEYDGAAFSGWQVQPNAPTVQGSLEEGLATMLRRHVPIQGAGRTDAGVHALGQAASFETVTELSTDRLRKGLCSLCGPHISVVSLETAEDGFNARFDARGKHYRYRLVTRPSPSPLLRDQSWHIHAPLDLDAMAEAAKMLVGRHDFAGFRASDDGRDNTMRHLWRIQPAVSPLSLGVIDIDVEGDAFLKNMVRIIAGTLVDVGRGRIDLVGVERALRTKDRQSAGITAPARGLTLVEVFYGSAGAAAPIS